MSAQALTLASAATLIRSRQISPVELTQMCLERVRAADDRIHSFILLREEEAQAAARAAEREIMAGRYRGPLHGAPIAFKDIFDRKGVATTAHSRVDQHRIATTDSAVAARLDAAGAIDLGKLALHEFALGGPSFDLPWPPARNPWDVERFTHGSSSGTAAAIAAGFILAGPGTDTAGSIRAPAALCGLAGLKPTFGLVSRAGVTPLSLTLDHVGPMAWTAEDCALLLQAMVGHDPNDPGSIDCRTPDFAAALTGDIRGLRIGVVRHFFERDHIASADTRAAIDDALAVFEDLGAEVREATLAPLGDYAAAGQVIMICEAYAAHLATLRAQPDAFGRIFRNRISIGALYDAEDYERALKAKARLSAAFTETMQEFDLLVTSVLPGEAPLIKNVPPWPPIDRPSMMTPFNLSGAPAMSTRSGFSANGLPLAMQIVGKPFADATVLNAAHAYELATPWRKRRPSLLAPMTGERAMLDAGVSGGC